MRRPLFILIGFLAIGAGVFGVSFLICQQICVSQAAKSADDLDWLRQEFHLSDAEMARVRELHNGYLPKCAAMCARIAAKKADLEATLNNSTNLSADAQKALTELAELRAQCQAQMLEHFAEVSRAMPSEQGQRYLEEMRRITLGEHEQIEQEMSDDAGHEHHH